MAEIPESLQKIKPLIQIKHTVDDNDRIVLVGNRLPILDVSEDQGAVDDKLLLPTLVMHLQSSPQQQQALKDFNTAQQTVGHVDFHHWLTPEEFASRFGAAPQDIKQISQYLISKGFSIKEISKGGLDIMFSGTAGQIKNTFHTEIHHFNWQGEPHIANTSDPQIPAAFNKVVAGLVNLHDFHSRSRHIAVQKGSAALIDNGLLGSNGPVASVFPILDVNLGGTNYLTPGDYANIYDINSLYKNTINGKGVTIAVLGRSNVNTSDISAFQKFVGQVNKLPQIIVTNSNPGYVNGDQMESSLDVEWATGIASGATVQFITSASTFTSDGVYLSAVYAVQHNVADIISLSYGACEAQMGVGQLVVWDGLWSQAVTQGQTVLVSSGDSGAAGCDSPSSVTASYGAGVNGLCSSPSSTCVGGTQFNDTGNPAQYWLASNPSGQPTTALGYIPETVWNNSASVSGGSGLEASGGGQSLYWSKPVWQVAPGVLPDGARDVPDVSLTAALHDGYIVYMNNAQYVVGGTSASTPAMAGIVALLKQYNGGRQGNINPMLYGLYQLQATGGYRYFHPTPSGNNSVPGQSGFMAAGNGYNLATGLGSVDVNLLVRHWQDLNNIANPVVQTAVTNATALLMPAATNTTLTASAATVTAGQSLGLIANVTGDNPTGNVQFLSGNTLLGTASLTNGIATLNTAGLTTVGNNVILASYTGDDNNLSSSSSGVSEVVLATTTIVVSSSSLSISAGLGLTLTATITGAAPTGMVQFYLNGQPLSAPVNVKNGTAILNTVINTTGQNTITASYSGDQLNAPSASASVSETVTAALPQTVPASNWLLEIILAILLMYAWWWLPKTRKLNEF